MKALTAENEQSKRIATFCRVQVPYVGGIFVWALRLAELTVPNLGSAVLSGLLARLNDDWQAR